MASTHTKKSAYSTNYDRMSGNCTLHVAVQMVSIISPTITPDSYILDNACGPGIVTEQIKLLHPDTKIMATDLSLDMIHETKVRMKTNGWSNVETDVLDVRSLSTLEDGSFSHVVTNMGLPVPGDPTSGLKSIKEMFRVLKKGGVAVMSTWADAFYKTARAVRPHEEPQTLMALGPEILRGSWLMRQMEEGGFENNVEVRPSATFTSASSLEELVDNMMLAKGMFFGGYTDEELVEAKGILGEELKRLRTFEVDGDGGVRIGMKAWIGIGWKKGDEGENKKSTTSFRTSRAFATSSTRYVTLPEPNQGPRTSIPPVHPERAEGGPQGTNEAIFKATQEAAARPRKLRGITETYTAYGVTEVLYKECARQADYTIPQATDNDAELPKTEDGEDLGVGEGWWHTELGLKPTFSTWSQVTMLHMYLLSARFRCFPKEVERTWQQHLTDHFFYDAENKMAVNHGMHARGTRNKYLKDMFIQWRGLLAAYDEGLARNDAVLAGAVWRNVFKGNEEVDIKKLAQIVSYMRRTLAGMDSVDDQKFMTGQMIFGGPKDEAPLVALKSKMMDLPFDKAPGKPMPPKK
ncbi:hypothetical protein G7Y89_g15119 [Cudoniella acicularis]|uniref:Methyltransferase domain-containing protein n=1 Tax=Cudoniella acicularis TaxID=354080 RepID=A0A8H4QTA0_9HELO|nr:hypothetical protein G7Y89_g15119 [Cudoniella acicularis]